jgi:putative Mg2+ transporter-C (MgtC) family protein
MNYSFLYGIICAIIFSGMIGLQRESLNRPAGLRTHILVCVGATISMTLNIVLSHQYPGIDPTRLGAAVISGIGFLGAGTIIKEGVAVSGLTTAASLWAVACIGLLIGSEYYLYAFVTTSFVFITLQLFAKFESKLYSSSNAIRLLISSESSSGQIGKIGTVLGEKNINIKKIYVNQMKNQTIQIQLNLESENTIENKEIVNILMSIEGIKSVIQL